jgi:NADPH2:quinone reductase
MAIQFAKAIGATVITTASRNKHEYVKKLGADVAIDYRDNVDIQVHALYPQGVDVVFDCVGGDVFTNSLACLKKGGRIVSTLVQMDPEKAKNRSVTAGHVLVAPSGPNLEAIKKLIEQKKVVPPHIEEMPLKEAAAAQEKLRLHKVFGKLVLQVS